MEQLEIVPQARTFSAIQDCKATANMCLGMISMEAIGAALALDVVSRKNEYN